MSRLQSMLRWGQRDERQGWWSAKVDPRQVEKKDSIFSLPKSPISFGYHQSYRKRPPSETIFRSGKISIVILYIRLRMSTLLNIDIFLGETHFKIFPSSQSTATLQWSCNFEIN